LWALVIRQLMWEPCRHTKTQEGMRSFQKTTAVDAKFSSLFPYLLNYSVDLLSVLTVLTFHWLLQYIWYGMKLTLVDNFILAARERES